MPVVFLTSASTSPWTQPGNWTDAGHTVELVGCGGQAGAASTGTSGRGGAGGGGGGYGKLTYSTGALGGTTPFDVNTNNTVASQTTNATSWQSATFTNSHYAGPGQPGVAAATQGVGGLAATSNGTPSPVTYTLSGAVAGGNGGAANTGAISGGAGGGGAGGPALAGTSGGASGATAGNGGGGGGAANNLGGGNGGTTTTATGGAGGPGAGPSHGGGVGSSSTTAPNGSAGIGGQGGGGGCGTTVTTASQVCSGYAGGPNGNASNWVQTSDSATAGSGGGGGGGGGSSGNVAITSAGGNGGNYGGGGGGAGGTRGANSGGVGTGASGLIVITYTAGATAQTLALAPGSYVETGQAVFRARGVTAPLVGGSYAETGQPVALPRGKSLSLAPGSYVETGGTVSRGRAVNLPLVRGTYAETGQPVSRTRAVNSPLVPAAYVESGQPIFRSRGFSTFLLPASYLETGQPVFRRRTVGQPLVAGSYSETGQPVSLVYTAGAAGRVLALAPGSYVETGLAVSRARGVTAALVPGVYVETGQPVFRKREVTLPLVRGVYSESGNPVALVYTAGAAGRSLALAPASYVEAGQPVSLVYVALSGNTRTLNLTPASYSETGAATWRVVGRTAPLVNGVYAESGQPIFRSRSVTSPLVGGSYSETGRPLASTRGTNLALLSGSYVATGRPVSRRRDITSPLVRGVMSMAGQPVGLVYGQHLVSPVIVLQSGSYVIGGMPVGLVYTPFTLPSGITIGVGGKYVACNYGTSGDGVLFGFSGPVYPFAPVEKGTDTGGAFVADWTQVFKLPDGTRPLIVLDFVNGQYFDGTNLAASLGSMVSGAPTIDANGMLCNSTIINGIGPLLAALQRPAVTIRAETDHGTNGVIGAIVGFQTGYCPLFEDSTSGNQVGGYNGVSVHGLNPDWRQRVYSATGWDAAGRDITANTAVCGFDSGTYATPTVVTLGSTWGTDLFGGYLRTLVVYPGRVSRPILQAITAPPPFLNWIYGYDMTSGQGAWIILDFLNQQYYDGVNNPANLATMLSGTVTVDANGLLCNTTNINAIGPLLAALQQPAVTIRAETGFVNSPGGVGAIVGFQAAAPPVLGYDPLYNYGGGSSQAAGWNGVSNILGPAFLPWSDKVYSVTAWDGLGRDIAANGSWPNSDSGTYPPPTAVTLGSAWGGNVLNGYLRSLAVYLVRPAADELESIANPLPFPPATPLIPLSGSHSVFMGGTVDYITPGPRLQIERTQPWSCSAMIRLNTKPAVAAVIFTNVIHVPWYGYELWVDQNGFLRVRIMSNWDTSVGPNGLLSVIGSINVGDRLVHTVAATYDGSVTPAGIKFYVDGVLDTATTVEGNTLSSSIINGTPDFWVGNQLGGTFQIGLLDNFVMSNVARSAAYIAANVGVLPAIDANTTLSYAFEEGHGTTTADGSASGFTGTLQGGTIWVP